MRKGAIVHRVRPAWCYRRGFGQQPQCVLQFAACSCRSAVLMKLLGSLGDLREGFVGHVIVFHLPLTGLLFPPEHCHDSTARREGDLDRLTGPNDLRVLMQLVGVCSIPAIVGAKVGGELSRAEK